MVRKCWERMALKEKYGTTGASVGMKFRLFSDYQCSVMLAMRLLGQSDTRTIQQHCHKKVDFLTPRHFAGLRLWSVLLLDTWTWTLRSGEESIKAASSTNISNSSSQLVIVSVHGTFATSALVVHCSAFGPGPCLMGGLGPFVTGIHEGDFVWSILHFAPHLPSSPFFPILLRHFISLLTRALQLHQKYRNLTEIIILSKHN